MKAWTWSGTLLLAAVSAVWAQAPDLEAGRAACLKFLATGEHAPRPELGGLGEVRSQRGHGDPAQGALTELVVPQTGPTRFTVAFDQKHAVVSYNAFDQALRLAPSDLADPDRARRAVALRARFSDVELQRRARVFFSARIPGRLSRRWTRVESRLCCDTNPVWYQVRFVELAPEGVLAVYPNQVVVGLNPESGSVVFYRATHVATRVTKEPPVDAESASLAAEQLCADARFDAPQLTLTYVAGELRAVWALLGQSPRRRLLVHVDARSARSEIAREQAIPE